jgi:ribosomal protein S18 acetylase RimI-like enzyme
MSHAVDQYRLLPARHADAETLADMSRRLVESGLQPSWGAARVRWHIDHCDSVVLVARHPQGTAGFAIMRFFAETAHLNLLAVNPAHRRRGVARALLTWLEGTALTAGTFLISLEVRASNEPALRFYRSLAYQERGSLPGYYQGMEAALRLERDLRLTTTRQS